MFVRSLHGNREISRLTVGGSTSQRPAPAGLHRRNVARSRAFGFEAQLHKVLPIIELKQPERIAMLMARPMEILSEISHPLVTLFSLASSGLLFLLGAKRSDGPQVTEEEIKVMLQQGVESGDFKASEQTMVANIFRLDSLKIGVIMTRRSGIVYLDVEDSDEENLAILAQGRFQTLPVCRGGLDEIVKIIWEKPSMARAQR